MIRTIVTPPQMQFDMSVSLPNDYVGKQVHVLFYIDDEVKNTTTFVSVPQHSHDFEITQEMKNILDERSKIPIEEYIPAEEVMKQIKQKYGL